MTEQLGVQLTPWSDAQELVAVGERFGRQVDTVFVQDQMLARNAYAVLAALAARGCGVGTNVTWPFGRNPVEMASAAATIGELLAPGRTMTLGMGSGGALVSALFDVSNRAAVMTESIRLLRGLWSGSDVALDDFPLLGHRLGYVPGAVARLSYPVPEPPRLVVACVGPKVMRVAADLADGFLCASNLAPHSRAALESGLDASVAKLVHDRAAEDPSYAMHYGMNVSVSADGELARAHARRQAALIVGNPSMWPALGELGFDMASAQATKQAFDDGLGVEGAARCVAQSVVEGLIIAGTPDEVVEPLASLRETAKAGGYGHFFLGGPLGPDMGEAAELLCDAVIPAIWPDRTAA